MRISDWSSDVCSSDLFLRPHRASFRLVGIEQARFLHNLPTRFQHIDLPVCFIFDGLHDEANGVHVLCLGARAERRSEEHTSELQSLMRISYAVFCLKKKKHTYKDT